MVFESSEAAPALRLPRGMNGSHRGDFEWKTLRFSTYGSVHPRIERGHGGLEKLYRKEWI